MEMLRILKNDPWLEPYSGAFNEWMRLTENKKTELTGGKSLIDFASGHQYFGLHLGDGKWFLREWAPNATSIYLIGTFNNWGLAADQDGCAGINARPDCLGHLVNAIHATDAIFGSKR